MTHNELLKYNRNRRICQICFVTDNLERTLCNWVEKMGVGPFKVMRKIDFVIDGKQVFDEDYGRYIALAMMGDIEIEIACPFGKKSPLWDHLNKHGRGFHHFKEYFSNVEEEKAQQEFTERGMPVISRGHMAGDSAWFVDSEPYVDFKLECGNYAYLCNEDLDAENVQYYYYPEK